MNNSAPPHLALNVLAAGQGDCLVIDYGNGTELRRVVIDAGSSGSYPALKNLLQARPDAFLELLVVSHIDVDHIGGAIRLVKDLEISRKFGDVWFNGFQHLQDSNTEGFGPRQGDQFTDHLLASKLPWNKAFNGKAVLVDSSIPVKRTLPGGASISLLSPTFRQLQLLRLVWAKEVADAMQGNEDSEEAATQNSGLERMGSSSLDNITQLAAREWRKDSSASNGSSIAFIFEFAGKRLLLSADAHADVLTASAHVSTGSAAPLTVDIFKLSHHGSASNTSAELLAKFPAQFYVVSTNGGHQHPDDEALARVVVANPNADIAFNYENEAYRRWKRASELQTNKFTVRSLGGEDFKLVLLPES